MRRRLLPNLRSRPDKIRKVILRFHRLPHLMPRHTRSVFRGTCVLIFLLSAGLSRPAIAQKRPQEFRTFLAQYTGREILFISMSSDSLQFADADSTQRFVVVLDDVSDDTMILHRQSGTDRRTFSCPIADIRRITYLFGGRRYKRIVVETF